MRNYKVFFLIFILLGGCTLKIPVSKEKNISYNPFQNRKDAIFSPEGSVPYDKKAFSPDNKYYAVQIQPFDHGNIGIFKMENNTLFSKINTQSVANDLKALAWTPDSSSIAVMFHGGNPSGISIYEIKTGKLLRNINIGKNYHFMVFSKNGRKIYLSEKENGNIDTFELRNTDFIKNSGFNLPWINYGWDIGRNPWNKNHGGFSSNKTILENKLEKIKESGGQIVRVFIFCDLRSGIIFDENRIPERFDKYVFDDFETLIETAKTKGLKIIPVLFDYTISDGVERENGIKVGEHPEIFTDEEKKKKLMTIFRNFFLKFSKNKAIYAWEIINEPEHIKNVPYEKVQKFIKDFVIEIKSLDKRAKITVGCLSLNSIIDYNKTGINIIQIHYYDSFGEISPLKIPAVNLPVKKPVLVGEIEGTDIVEKLSSIWENGYKGALFWIDENFNQENFYYYRVWTSVH